MTEVVLTAVVVLAAVSVGWTIHLARTSRFTSNQIAALAALCATGLMAMLLTDWPTDLLSRFWADHSILASLISTILLVGLAFLVWERSEQVEQERLAQGLSGAGLGGVVDHVVDVEVALALLSHPQPPTRSAWQGWDAAGKPLRWLRAERQCLARGRAGGVAKDDPRCMTAQLPPSVGAWRMELIDQAVRRLLAAMRDWSPLIGASREGVTALLALSELRKDLMELSSLVEAEDHEAAVPLLILLRQRLRVLAHFFEESSGAVPPRPEVLLTMDPLPPLGSDFTWAADGSSGRLFSRAWQQRLDRSHALLAEGP